MPIAITRAVSRTLGDCELTHLVRQSIDIGKAIAQHQEYERALAECGASVLSLPALDEHPDAVFVEDPAIVLDEIAVMATMGAESRRGERPTLASALARFRPVVHMQLPGKLEGGDVLRMGRNLFVGLSGRSDHAGISQLAGILRSHNYTVTPVELRDCLHLKSAVTAIGPETLLINRNRLDTAPLSGYQFLDVPPSEPAGANALRIHDTVLLPSAYPATADMLRRAGFPVRELDLSELLKAESGVTCSSLVFESAAHP